MKQFGSKNKDYLIIFLTIVTIANLISLGWFGWQTLSSYHDANLESEKDSKVEELRGIIIHFDEILSMSARMAAATGELKWEDRYNEFESELDSAINEAITFASDPYCSEAARKTAVANINLVAMEKRAFELVRNGDTDSAMTILISKDYELQKQLYAQGMTSFARSRFTFHRLIELRGFILYFDEALTMSARMAAATGNLVWEDRYRIFEIKLDAAINEAIALSPGVSGGEAAAKTDAANVKLIEMENHAFDLIRQGKKESAMEILFGKEYEKQKQIYAGGMKEFASYLAADVSSGLRQERSRTFLKMALVLTLLTLLAFTWFLVIGAVRRWRSTLIDRNHRLTAQADELAELNRNLDNKVSERTRELDISRKVADKARHSAEKARENVEEINKSLIEEIFERKRAVRDNKKLVSQLHQADKMASIGTLAAGVAHEINNPIGFINSNLNTMNKYLKKIEPFCSENTNSESVCYEEIYEILNDFNDAIAESLEGTDRVKKIVTDLKSFSRVDRAEKSYADINEGIETTLNIVWNELKYKCNVKKNFGELTQIMCIPNQLNQVFLNILVNASQAIEKMGIVHIRTWQDDEHIYISIKDNGCGIPEDKINKIFEPFFTTKEVGKGTGLGLSLVFDIIKKHSGSIKVDSEVGVGTEFIISLPFGERTDE